VEGAETMEKILGAKDSLHGHYPGLDRWCFHSSQSPFISGSSISEKPGVTIMIEIAFLGFSSVRFLRIA